MSALTANWRFHEAARKRAAQLVAECGETEALAEARRLRLAAAPGDAKVFAYNVEVYVAEIAGVNPSAPGQRPLGPSRLFQDDIRLPGFLLRFAERAAGRFLKAAPEPPPEAGRTESPCLTPRQIECLQWAAQGKSSWDIGRILGISPRTVDEHLESACRKLGVKRRSQAVLAAHRRGLLDTTP